MAKTGRKILALGWVGKELEAVLTIDPPKVAPLGAAAAAVNVLAVPKGAFGVHIVAASLVPDPQIQTHAPFVVLARVAQALATKFAPAAVWTSTGVIRVSAWAQASATQ
jgi:hypothetical protein